MGKKIDIVIKKAGQLVAYVEVKNRKKLSVEDAKELRMYLMTNLTLPLSGYFLLVSQDQGYLWMNTTKNEFEEPTCNFPMDTVIERYFKIKNPEKRLRNTELEFIIYQWLNDLTFKPRDEKHTLEPEKSLFASGFIEKMHSAHVTMEDEI